MKSNPIILIDKPTEKPLFLKKYLEENGYTKIYMVSDQNQVIYLTQKQGIILVNTDYINREGFDWFDIVKTIKDHCFFQYIFYGESMSDQKMVKMKSIQPYGFIGSIENISILMINLEMAIKANEFDFTYSQKGITRTLDIRKVKFIESDGHYVKIFTSNDKTLYLRKTLCELKNQFPNHLIRIHKSTLINVDKIEGYNSTKIEIEGEKLNIGRAYRKDIIDHFSNKLNRLNISRKLGVSVQSQNI